MKFMSFDAPRQGTNFRFRLLSKLGTTSGIGWWLSRRSTFEQARFCLMSMARCSTSLTTPHSVAVPQRLKHALKALELQSGGATSFVSGRSMADLDRLFAPLQACCSRRPWRGAARPVEVPRRNTSRPRFLQSCAGGSCEFGASHEGLILEDKGYSLALHYRLAAAVGAPPCTPRWRRSVPTIHNASSTCWPGKSVVEVKPSGFNKGTGIRELMKSCAVPRTPADLHRRRRDRRGGVRGPAGIRRAWFLGRSRVAGRRRLRSRRQATCGLALSRRAILSRRVEP